MKRRTFKYITCAAITALTLSVTACGGSDDGKTTGVEETTNTEEEKVTEPEDKDHVLPDSMYESVTDGLNDEEADAAMDAIDAMIEADTSEFQTLEDYFTEPSIKSAYENLFATVGQEGMETSMEVTGNDIAFIFQITDSSMITDVMAESIERVLASADLSEQVKAFDDMVGEAGACTVTMRYLYPDGTVLAEHTYTTD